DVGLLQPGRQAALGDPEILRDLLQRGLALAGDGHDVVPKLGGIGLGHGQHPSSKEILTGQVSSKAWAVPMRSPQMAQRLAKAKSTKTLEQTLWEAADKLRGNQEPSEYKHVVLGLVFLKYVSDRFEERRDQLKEELTADGIKPERIGAFLEERDEYTSNNVFWVPEKARWASVQDSAKHPQIGEMIDNAMDAIEKENPSLRGVLPRNYGRDGLDKRRLGELVDLIGSIGFTETDDHGADDVLGRVYEYFLGQFAGKETGKDAGAFYTPRSVVRTLVEMLEPYKGRVYDPAAGS